MTVKEIVSDYQSKIYHLLVQMNSELGQFGVCLEYVHVDTIYVGRFGEPGEIVINKPRIEIKVK